MDPPEISIHQAVITGNMKAVKQHIRVGTDLDAKDDFGSTPLIVATTFGVNDAAFALIEAGVDLSLTNNDGSAPLHIAAFFCYTEIVEALLAAGADREAKNNDGRTAFESVAAPFEVVKPIYEGVEKSLAPLGFKLDYEHLEETRPKIAELLSS